MIKCLGPGLMRARRTVLPQGYATHFRRAVYPTSLYGCSVLPDSRPERESVGGSSRRAHDRLDRVHCESNGCAFCIQTNSVLGRIQLDYQ
jgi:hypothetical protein